MFRRANNSVASIAEVPSVTEPSSQSEFQTFPLLPKSDTESVVGKIPELLTNPDPFGEKMRSPFASVVEMVLPSICTLSTSRRAPTPVIATIDWVKVASPPVTSKVVETTLVGLLKSSVPVPSA